MFDSLTSVPREQRWSEQIHPLPVVISIICRPADRQINGDSSDSYLLIRRNSEPYRSRWALVGGKWDFGETLAGAAVREVKEETGLEATFVALRGLVNERLASASGEEGVSAHFLIFVCQLDAGLGEATEQAEGAVGWFTRSEIEGLQAEEAIIPSDYAMLNSFIGAPSVTHFEVDMLGEQLESSSTPIVSMLRFEKIE